MNFLITSALLQTLVIISVALDDDNDAITISNFSFNSYYDTISGLPRKIDSICFENCTIKNLGYSFFNKFTGAKEFVFFKCEIVFDTKDYFNEKELFLSNVTFKQCDIKLKKDQLTEGIWKEKLIIKYLSVF